MEVKYLFLIPRTPKPYRNDLRNALWELCKEALLKQEFDDWKALIITDEEEEQKNNFIYLVDENAKTKKEKIKAGLNFIKTNFQLEYLIRLDDDDLIMPLALQKASNCLFDACTESLHTFYEITSGRISQQKRDWFPNTMIHKCEHAVAPFGVDGSELLLQDHSVWHEYYQHKQVEFFNRQSPLYVRILSPNSITSRATSSGYFSYLNGFGNWSVKKLKGFSLYRRNLNRIKLSFLKGYEDYQPNSYYEKILMGLKIKFKNMWKLDK